MRRFDQLLLFGFILVFTGLALIVLGQDTVGGFVFVFPFFFVGDIDPLLVIPLILAMIVMFFLMMKPFASSIQDNRVLRETSPVDQFVRIREACLYCGGPIPERSEYCPSCGTSLETGREQ